MNPERWSQVKTLLAGALNQPDSAARDAYLSAECNGHTTLRREVESLLDQTTGSLEACAEGLNEAVSLAHREDGGGAGDPNVGRRVGAWLLGERLGAGGMGAVYLARRAGETFQQTAAVKLLRRGTDTEEVLRRFRAERQILARLEHPNIARLLDGGETDDGLPFFVLEHVVGARLTDFARAAELSVPRRLELFRKICAAVHYAHQNLVVHRDLKPGNILVSREGEPKLLDFGIAKLLEEDEGAAEHTVAGHGRLTPGYASPEQARGEPVTTVSDVYALGALLYELLVGRTPHRFNSPRPAPTELARVIGEQVPTRPSLAAANPALRRHLRGDLDNIILKALEKAPGRRYPTVNGLAEDVRRHLEGRPVRARSATWGYVLRRFVGRNRLAAAAAAVVALALLGGVGGTLWQASRAERRFNDLRRLAHSLLFEVDEALERGPTAARHFLVQRALENLDDLDADSRGDVGLQRDLAAAYRKVGDVQSRLDSANLGDTAGAVVSYRRALDLREGLFVAWNDPADARALAGDHGRLGDMLAKTGDTAGALAAYRRAVELMEAHPAPRVDREARREAGRMHDRLGCTLQRTGDTEGAFRYIAAGRADRTGLADAAPDDVATQLDVSRSDCSLAYLLGTVGRTAEALALDQRNAALFSRLAAAHPEDLTLRHAVMDGHEWLGLGLTATGDLPGALAEFRLALGEAGAALARDPANMQAHNDLGDVLHEIGEALQRARNPAAAADHHRRALEQYRAVANADPVNVHARREVAHVEHELALALGASGHAPGAVAGLRAVLPRFEALAAGDPDNVEFAHDRARCLFDLGKFLIASGDREAGREAAARALPLYDALTRRAPHHVRIAAERTELTGWFPTTENVDPP